MSYNKEMLNLLKTIAKPQLNSIIKGNISTAMTTNLKRKVN